MADPPFRMERDDKGIRFTFDLQAEKGDRQTKRATFAQFEMMCDEGAALGGDDSAPPPLAYFAAAYAF